MYIKLIYVPLIGSKTRFQPKTHVRSKNLQILIWDFNIPAFGVSAQTPSNGHRNSKIAYRHFGMFTGEQEANIMKTG